MQAVVCGITSDFDTLDTTDESMVKIFDVLGVRIGPTRMLNEYLPALISSGTSQTYEPEFGMFSACVSSFAERSCLLATDLLSELRIR
jgi:hypothetical protein